MNSAARAALACLAALACSRQKAALSPPEDEQWIAREALERSEAKVAEVRPRVLPSPIVTAGRIAFDDLRVSHVFSPVTGRVTRLLADYGQLVGKGTALAAIVSPDVGSAVSDEVKARADLVAAEHDFERQKQLFAAKAASSRDFETAEDNYRKAKAEEERALKRLRLLRAGHINAVTQEYLLPSPIGGRVMAMSVNPGVDVQGQFSGGAPSGELFTVGDIDQVWLFADVAESEMSELEVGAPITARVLAYPGRSFHGMVEWISATFDPALRTTRIRCALPNPDGLLKPEMFATVSIERLALTKLAVPRGAVVRIHDQSFVYVNAGERPDGKEIFKRRHVQLSEYAGPPGQRGRPASEVYLPIDGAQPEWVAVLAGLVEGEKVLVDGAPPRARRDEEAFLTGAQWSAGTVATAVAEERDLPDFITVGGRLTFEDHRVTHVFSPVNGRIEHVLAAPGQRVRKGDPLAVLLSQDMGSAFSDELKAKADLIAVEHEVSRQREMFALQAASGRDLEAAEDNFGRAKAEYERAAQKARLLRARGADGVSQEFVLRSPMDGEVLARNANPGAQVQGQYSAGPNVVELFTIGRIEELYLMSDVYEVDLSSVRRGAEVELEVAAYPGRIFRGRVDWISDVLDPVLRTAKVRCVLQNRERLLRPEMYEMARIAAPGRRAITVPREALLRLGDETDVFVAEPPAKDSRVAFRRRAVVADEQIPGDLVAVLAGLQSGERVASRGSIFLVGN
jgi:cobalt-zinc-cadmium efflux system membrane fusion protein